MEEIGKSKKGERMKKEKWKGNETKKREIEETGKSKI